MLIEEKQRYQGLMTPVFERAIVLLGSDGFRAKTGKAGALVFQREPSQSEKAVRGCTELVLRRRAAELRLRANFPTDKWVALAMAVFAFLLSSAHFNERAFAEAALATLIIWTVMSLVFFSIRYLVQQSHRKELQRLLYNLTTELPREEGQASLARLSARSAEHQRCAYCHSEDGALMPQCPACGTALHPECWTEAGRCPSLGCNGGRTLRARERREA